MKFKPKSDKEIAEDGLLPDGTYDFTITQALDKVSKNGNDMIEVLMRVFRPDGSFELVTDYLMEKIAYKLKHACDACGLSIKYDMGELNADDFVEKSGKVKLKIHKDKNGEYPDKNVVVDYVVEKSDAVKPQPVKKVDPQAPIIDSDLSDEIPF